MTPLDCRRTWLISVKRTARGELDCKARTRKHSKKPKSTGCPSAKLSGINIDLDKLNQTCSVNKEYPKNKKLGRLTHGTRKLLLTSLPCSVNQTILRDIFPSVIHLNLRNTAGSKHALLDFSSNDDYLDAVNRLKSIEFDGTKPNYQAVVGYTENTVQSNLSKQFVTNSPNCLIIRNLPYSLTATEIKEHFPMANRVHLGVNKFGIFNGSCTLEMKNKDDLQVVIDECKHKYINNRLVRANLQCKSKSESSKPPYASYGLKLKEVPNVIDDDRIKALFPETSLTGLSSTSRKDSNTRNVFIFFKKSAQRKAAFKMFKNEVVMGYPISCRLWVPTSRRRKSQTKKIEEKVNDTVLNYKVPKSNELHENGIKWNMGKCGNVSSSFPKKLVFESDGE
uniref:RRM domain-containing protein n=2 Tax=Schistosoma mansoni TaxID=6183 RepID=A0A3Q0KFG3_SCHMA